MLVQRLQELVLSNLPSQVTSHRDISPALTELSSSNFAGMACVKEGGA